MKIKSTLAALADLLRKADPTVTVCHPTTATRGLCIWPWSLVPTVVSRPPPRPGQPTAPPDTFDLRLLVLPRKAASIDDLATLDGALELIVANPILPLKDGTIRLSLEAGLAPSELAGLFTAAGIPMSICLAVLVRVGAA